MDPVSTRIRRVDSVTFPLQLLLPLLARTARWGPRARDCFARASLDSRRHDLQLAFLPQGSFARGVYSRDGWRGAVRMLTRLEQGRYVELGDPSSDESTRSSSPLVPL